MLGATFLTPGNQYRLNDHGTLFYSEAYMIRRPNWANKCDRSTETNRGKIIRQKHEYQSGQTNATEARRPIGANKPDTSNPATRLLKKHNSSVQEARTRVCICTDRPTLHLPLLWRVSCCLPSLTILLSLHFLLCLPDPQTVGDCCAPPPPA